LSGLGTPFQLARQPQTAVSPAATDYYFLNGDDLFHISPAGLWRAYGVLTSRSGSHSVTISRARFPEAPRDVALDAPFHFGNATGWQEIVPLGTGYDVVLESSGMDLDEVAGWDDVVTWCVTATPESVTSTFVRGLDSVSVSVAWTVLDRSPATFTSADSIDVRINGMRLRLDGATFLAFQRSMVGGASVEDVDLPAGLDAAMAGLVDFSGLLNAVTGFHILEARLRSLGMPELPGMDNSTRHCWSECLGCSGALVAVAAADAAVVAACGGAVATAGGLTAACIAALLTLNAAHLAAVGACLACHECLRPPDPEPDPDPVPTPQPDPTCPCRGMPFCDCM
jgi:hypothetical protein